MAIAQIFELQGVHKREGSHFIIKTQTCRVCGKTYLPVPFLPWRMFGYCVPECRESAMVQQLANLLGWVAKHRAGQPTKTGA